MSELYNILLQLCEDRGISGYRMCKDVGIQPSVMTDLKMGRRSSVKMETAQKIADYFGVSVGYLLGVETEKAPAETGERVNDDDIKAAFFGGVADDLSTEEIDELWEDARRFARYIAEQKKKEK